jgi:Holliday junction resolvasome RuvABC endonuclease subunit
MADHDPGLVWRDPKEFADYIRANRKSDHTSLVLGIDPGTKCGYSYGFVSKKSQKIYYPEPPTMGFWDLSLKTYDSGGLRWLRLRHFLFAAKPDVVLMEGRDFGGISMFGGPNVVSGMKAAELLACVRGTLTLYCEEHDIPCGTVATGKVKQRATGRGNANKTQIVEACNKEFGTNFEPDECEKVGTDNIADAAFICCIALEELADGLL